jgi:hypothetical protein
MYASHLQKTEGLTREDASLKALYIAQQFHGEDWMLMKMQWKTRRTPEELDLRKTFEESTVFLKDLDIAESRLAPFDLFAALWIVLRKEEYKPGAPLRLGLGRLGSDKFNDYDSFIKKKAVIARLEQMSVLEKGPARRDGEVRYRLMQEDLETLRSVIYRGTGHEDEYFQAQWAEEKLLPVLEKDNTPMD